MSQNIIKQQQKELRAIFNVWDFLEGAPEDEYDCMVDGLISRLSKGISLPEISEYINYELKDHFGISIKNEEVRQYSKKIFDWYTGKY